MKKIKYTRKKLADGFEENVLKQKFNIQVNGKNLEFELKKFYNNSFNELNRDFETKKIEIAENEKFIINEFDGSFQSPEKLELLYELKENLIFIFSYGEFQPTRYILYLEGIYSLK